MRAGANQLQRTRPKGWQQGRSRCNQIPGRRDQQSTVWTRRYQRTNQGRGGRRGQEERTGKPQPHKGQEQKQAQQQSQKHRKRANETRHPQPSETENQKETQRPANTRHKRDNQNRQQQRRAERHSRKHNTQKGEKRASRGGAPTHKKSRKGGELRNTSVPAQSADRHTCTQKVKFAHDGV